MLSEERYIETVNTGNRMGNFKIIEIKKGSSLSLDSVNAIVKIEWEGHVNLETAQFLLTRAADEIEKGIATKILLNRKSLEQFANDARKWIKDDFLRGRARTLVHLVEKVATVKSSTKIGDLFASVVSSSIKLVFPRLRMSRFDTEDEATKWLLV
ncbi:MAG: hypothetical protein ABJI55_11905 [Ekhidna sp.]